MIAIQQMTQTPQGVTSVSSYIYKNRIFDVTVYTAGAGFQIVKVIDDANKVYIKVFATKDLKFGQHWLGNNTTVQIQIVTYVITQMFSDMVI